MTSANKTLVIALGGNALGNNPQEQLQLVKKTAEAIVDLALEGYRVVVGHGNGPQVGMINNAMLYAYTDPESPAGGISVDGWKTLWNYCANGNFTGDSYGLEPLIRGDVQVSTFYSSSLYGNIEAAEEAGTEENPLRGTLEPENWDLVEIDDGTYYIAEYIGILDKAGRTEAQTAQVEAFAEWFGGADFQAAWADAWDTYPCNSDAASQVYDTTPAIYQIKNFALNKVEGTDLDYASYVAAHSAEWTNILTNLGFYWADSNAPAEPDWDSLDWGTLTQKQG